MYSRSSIYLTKKRQRTGEQIVLSQFNHIQKNENPRQLVSKKIEPIIYRYKLYQNGPGSPENAVQMPILNTDNLVFNYMATLPMYDNSWNVINDSYIVYTGYRTKPSTDPGIVPPIPSVYTETIDINVSTGNSSRNDFITAKLNYVDGGSENATLLTYLKFTILGADGIFKGKTNLEIFYNNDDYTREIKIT